MKIQLIGSAMILAGTLSACSSSSSSSTAGEEVDQFSGLFSSTVAVGDVGENITLIGVDDLPDEAELTGYLAAVVDTPENLYVGDATATADFSAGSLIGTVDNFNGYETSAACETETAADGCTGTIVQSFDGSVDITGTITGTEFEFNAAGTLSGDDLVGDGAVTVNVDLDGEGTFGTIDDNLVAFGVSEGAISVNSDDGTETIEAGGLLILEE